MIWDDLAAGLISGYKVELYVRHPNSSWVMINSRTIIHATYTISEKNNELVQPGTQYRLKISGITTNSAIGGAATYTNVLQHNSPSIVAFTSLGSLIKGKIDANVIWVDNSQDVVDGYELSYRGKNVRCL